MNTFGNILLSTTDRFSRHLGPVTALIDTVVDHIAPKGKALALPSTIKKGSVTCYLCGTSCNLCACGCGDKGDYVGYYYTTCGGYYCGSLDVGCDYC